MSSMQMDPQMLSAILGQLGQAGSGAQGGPDMEGQEQYTPGDIPRQLIDLTHEAIRQEPDASDKSLLGKILAMLLQYQERQASQGQ